MAEDAPHFLVVTLPIRIPLGLGERNHLGSGFDGHPLPSELVPQDALGLGLAYEQSEMMPALGPGEGYFAEQSAVAVYAPDGHFVGVPERLRFDSSPLKKCQRL